MRADPQVLKRLSELRRARENWEARVAHQVVVGRSRALTISEMAKRLKMSRQGLYKLLARQGVELEDDQNPKPPDPETRG